jgi:alcohol dehydrogenase, propanol-preferring
MMHRENLCDHSIFTGFTRDGGYATATIAYASLRIPARCGRQRRSACTLLCAGLIGWRWLVTAGDGKKLGLYGFGAAAHIVAQAAKWQGRSVFAFTRPRDVATQGFARSLGAT